MSAPYDAIADWYDSVTRAGTIVQSTALCALVRLAGDVRDRHLCDLACGQGIAARAFAKEGAHVFGVDISSKLLRIARAEEDARPMGVQYARMDAANLTQLAAESFDGVICNMALMDIADLSSTIFSVHRILRDRGWFAFTVMHPCFETPSSSWIESGQMAGAKIVRGYFDEGRWLPSKKTGMRARVGSVHRMLESYLNSLADGGFSLEAIAEPQIAREPGKVTPAYDVVPAVLCVRARKRHVLT